MVVDSSMQVIVADCLNERVVLLTPELRLERVLLTSLGGQLRRIYLNTQTGILFVGRWYSSDSAIAAYRIQNK